MARRPERFLIVGDKVFNDLLDAPPWVRESFTQLMTELSTGPYPDQHPRVAEARGTDRKHAYVAWSDDVRVFYLVMQDQPVISLIAVHWRTGGGPPPDDGESGPDWSYSLAA